MQPKASQIKSICKCIARQGFAVVEQAFPESFTRQLIQQLQIQQPKSFKQAGIGRESGYQTDEQVRSDHIMWIDQQHPGCQDYFNWSESLRLALNEQFYLGLFDYECLFAHYPPGAFYQKHVDAFRHQTSKKANRKISTILYLNPEWCQADGGELLLFHHDQEQPFEKVVPQLGTLVVFLSEEFPHEVLPATKSRFSLTGWFRVNS